MFMKKIQKNTSKSLDKFSCKSCRCKNDDIDLVKNHQITGRYCELRNNTPLEKLDAGMGDIFIKLAR